MKLDQTSACDICGKPRGLHFDHVKCSKIRQKRGFVKEARPNRATVESLSKTGGTEMGSQQGEGLGLVRKCDKCGGAMFPGMAIEQTLAAGVPDFPGDTVACTYSPGGPGRLVECLKCEKCGWSVTK